MYLEDIKQNNMMNKKISNFPIGEINTGYAQYFDGKSYLAHLTSSDSQVVIDNVTFEPECRNHWHIHHGAQQTLICVGGNGWYQEWGKPAVKMNPGDVIEIPLDTKHWHGAAKDSWLSHLSVMSTSNMKNSSTEWLEEVVESDYDKLK